METMQLLLLTMGLSLLSLTQAKSPPLTPALSKELLGNWYIISWAGNMPIPARKKTRPLPSFMFARNNLNKLEFRMNIMKPIGCVQFKLPLDEVNSKPGNYHAWSGHYLDIMFLPTGKDHAIAYYEGKVVNTSYKMSMLMGRTLDHNPEAVKIFEDLMEEKGLKDLVVHPPQAGTCKLAKDSS